MAIAGYNPEEAIAFGLECLLTQVEHNQEFMVRTHQTLLELLILEL
jgi:hypothetical protein